MKKYNVNSTMYIHILPKGWDLLNRKYGSEYVDYSIKPHKVIINGKEYIDMQCWDVFRIFPTTIGRALLFETEVIFKEEDLENI
jgi:hypothetical protein